MIEYMLSSIIEKTFEDAVGKGQGETRKALHVGFDLNPSGEGENRDQYSVDHMYVYAPMNYVYVAVQNERIDADGNRHVGPMVILSYHDSCWRDAIQQYIFKNRDRLSVFRSFGHLFDWYDVLDLTPDEVDYLYAAECWRRDHWKNEEPFAVPNPFDKRGIWKDR